MIHVLSGAWKGRSRFFEFDEILMAGRLALTFACCCLFGDDFIPRSVNYHSLQMEPSGKPLVVRDVW